MDTLFEAKIDDQEIEKWHVQTEGKNLVARVLPRDKWPESFEKFDESADLYLFAIPTDQYIDLEEQIQSMKDKEVVMGEIPTLIEYKKPEIITELKPDHLYDLFSMGQVNGDRKLAGGGRLQTQEGEVPYDMTFDELKFLAIDSLGLSQEDAQNVRAKIEPMTAWGNRGRFIIAGFNFGEKKPKINYGLMVNHMGQVSCYHGIPKQEIREHLGFK
jgi:hypothetical protein